MENEKKIKVVLLEPGKLARAVEIDASLAGMQKVVGGLIEPFYPFEEQVCIVCNEESKINGMRPNRSVKNDDGVMVDFIFGPAFICDCRGENLGQSFRRADRPLRQDVPLSRTPCEGERHAAWYLVPPAAGAGAVMLFRSVAKCSAYGTNAMHCTSKHRRCDTTTALVREIPETLFVPTHAEDDIFLCKSIEKHRNVPFPRPKGQTEMMHTNFMHQHSTSVVMPVCA